MTKTTDKRPEIAEEAEAEKAHRAREATAIGVRAGSTKPKTPAPRPGERGFRKVGGSPRQSFAVIYHNKTTGTEKGSSANEVREIVRRQTGHDPLSIKLIRS